MFGCDSRRSTNFMKAKPPQLTDAVLDKSIDQLIDERKVAESVGHRQNETDSLLLLSLLFEDVRRHPQNYAN